VNINKIIRTFAPLKFFKEVENFLQKKGFLSTTPLSWRCVPPCMVCSGYTKSIFL